MVEVEMKFPIRDFAAVASRLAKANARQISTRQDIDQYFNAPDRDFARTDEALRIRGIGSANFVTYKGPKQDAQTKTRTEIEVPLAEGVATAEAFARLLAHLGYRPVGERETGWEYEREDGTIDWYRAVVIDMEKSL